MTDYGFLVAARIQRSGTNKCMEARSLVQAFPIYKPNDHIELYIAHYCLPIYDVF
jgi:hypothetical protein